VPPNPVYLETRFALSKLFHRDLPSTKPTNFPTRSERTPYHPPKSKKDPSVCNPAGCLLIVLIVPLDPSAILLVGVSQVTSQRIPRHSTSIASPHWSPQLRASTFRQHLQVRSTFLDLCSWFLSSTSPRHALLASSPFDLLTFTSLFIVPLIRSLRPCLLPATCCITIIHANNLSTSYSLPRSTFHPIHDSGTTAPAIHNCGINTIPLITRIHDDRSR